MVTSMELASASVTARAPSQKGCGAMKIKSARGCRFTTEPGQKEHGTDLGGLCGRPNRAAESRRWKAIVCESILQFNEDGHLHLQVFAVGSLVVRCGERRFRSAALTVECRSEAWYFMQKPTPSIGEFEHEGPRSCT